MDHIINEQRYQIAKAREHVAYATEALRVALAIASPDANNADLNVAHEMAVQLGATIRVLNR